jgi:hypothetical protein
MRIRGRKEEVRQAFVEPLVVLRELLARQLFFQPVGNPATAESVLERFPS